MATRHELIHIDFVANAGKANPVMKSLQVACDDARVAKEKLDKELANAKAAGAPAKVIADIEGRLKDQDLGGFAERHARIYQGYRHAVEGY